MLKYTEASSDIHKNCVNKSAVNNKWQLYMCLDIN